MGQQVNVYRKLKIWPGATVEGWIPNLPGDHFFVDADHGSDANDGFDWTTAKLTIAAALALCTSGNDDYVFIRGNFSDSAIAITTERTHLIGVGLGWGKGYYAKLNSGASATGATILVQARDVEIANLEVLGNRDVGKHYPAIFLDGDNSGTRAHVHDCFIPMLTPSATVYCDGIKLVGDRHVIERCIIESQANGIWVTSGTQATYEIYLRDLVMYANNVGILIDSLQESTGQHGLMGENIFIDGHGAYAVDKAIKVTAGYPSFRNCDVGGYAAVTTLSDTVTVGNGKYSDCRRFGLTGYGTAFS